MSPQTLENVHFSKNYVEILCAAALRSRGTPVPGFRFRAKESLYIGDKDMNGSCMGITTGGPAVMLPD